MLTATAEYNRTGDALVRQPLVDCALPSLVVLCIKFIKDVLYELEKVLNNRRVLRIKGLKGRRTERLLVNLNLSSERRGR
jgi:hypothetical protein